MDRRLKLIAQKLKSMAWGMQALADDLLNILETAEGGGELEKNDDGGTDQGEGGAVGGV